MNESRTSIIFAAVAAVSLGLAWWSRPDSIANEDVLKVEVTGQPVFAKFEDPSAAQSFQIIKYDEALGQLERFEVAKDKAANMWKLPSFEDYPADAAEQVRDATTPLISMPILSVASLDKGDHTLYGVVNPDNESLSVGESGVGMLVRVKGEANEILAELVIGKEVGGAEGQRYVRVPTEDATYIVEIKTDPFTTEFQKWIKKELLEVRSFDIAALELRDYAILPTQQGYGMSRNFDADLAFDSAANKWSMERFVSYEGGKAKDDQLKEGEKLNDTALNDLRNAVQDLQIVNVRRKPKGLAADLKADKSLMENKESLQSLVSQGFIPQESAEGTEIFATGGETLIGTQAGVKYLLRFGEVVANLSSADEAAEGGGLRRYLLVSAVVDESKFPAPDLEPLPETVEDMLARQKKEQAPPPASDQPPAPLEINVPQPQSAPKTEAAAEPPASEADKKPEADKPAEEKPAAELSATEKTNSDANDKTAETPDAPAADASNSETPQTVKDPDSCDPQEKDGDEKTPVAETSGAQDEAKPQSSETAAQEAAAQEAAAQETKANSAEKADVKAGDAPADASQPAKDEPPAKTEEELKEELEFVREQIAKENQRKIDDRKEKMDAARKRTQELNARFADWYYVVSDSVYKKLKVSREQLIVADKPATETDSAAPVAPGSLPQFDQQPNP